MFLPKYLMSLLVVSSLAMAAPIPAPNGGSNASNPDGTSLTWDHSVAMHSAALAQANLDADHTVYVDCLSGNNGTANGSTLSKYGTFGAAEGAITLASPTNPYQIVIAAGVCTETNLALKPNIFINGNNATLNVTGTLSLTADWGSGGNSMFVKDLQLNPSNATTWDFTGFGAHSDYIEMSNVRVLQNWNFSILGTSQEIVVLDGLFATNPQIDLTLQDVYGGVQNASPYNLSIINTGSYSGTVMTLSDDEVLGSTLVQAQGAQNQIVNFTANSLTVFGGTVTLDGANIIAAFDPSSFSAVPTLLNGATYTLKSPATGVTVNYSPSNYTPDVSNEPGNASNPSVDANFRGLDNTLGSVGTAPIAQWLYVTPEGVDTPSRNGTYNSSFASYPYALSVAESNASAGNVYGIRIVGNQTISGNMDLNPYVVVDCADSGTINVSGFVDLDGYWGTANNVNTAVVENCRINSGSGFEFIFSGDQNVLELRNVDPGTTTAMVAISPGSPPNGNGLLVRGMVSKEGPVFSDQVDIDNGFLFAQDMTVSGILYVNALGTTNTFANLVSSQINSLYISSVASSGGTASANLQATQLNGLTLASALSNLTSDVSSYITPSLIAGAAISQVSVLNNTDGLGFSPNFSPSHFSLIGSSSYGNSTTTAAFAGIDAAFGTPVSQQLFVNGANGNDSNVGTSSSHALATYDNGAYSICVANANASNPYTVYVIGNSSVTNNFNLVPYCNVIEVGGTLTIPGQVVLDSSFASANNSTTKLSGVINAQSGINMAYGAGDNNFINLNIDPTSTPSIALSSPTGPTNNSVWLNIIPNPEYFALDFSSSISFQNLFVVAQNLNAGTLVDAYSTGSSGAALVLENSQAAVQIDGSSGPEFFQFSNSTIGAMTLISTDATGYITDQESYPASLSLLSGATIGQISIFGSTDGGQFSTTFVPSSFSLVGSSTWSATSITAAFAGIDAALGNLQPSLSGSFTPSVSCVSGCTSPTAVTGFYSSTGSASGDVETVTISATFTTTTLSGIFRASCPINPNFNSSSQAGGVGTLNRTSSAGIGDGAVLTINSVATNGVNFGWVTAIPTTNYTLNATYQCYIH